jgi:hypothetical protein
MFYVVLEKLENTLPNGVLVCFGLLIFQGAVSLGSGRPLTMLLGNDDVQNVLRRFSLEKSDAPDKASRNAPSAPLCRYCSSAYPRSAASRS